MVFMSMLIFLGFSLSHNFFFFWLFLVLISTEFIRMVNLNEMKFKYFVISEISLMVFVMGLIFEQETVATTSLLVKIGFPPFHTWVLEIFMSMKSMEAFFIMTWTKFLPVFLLLHFWSYKLFMLLVVSFALAQALSLANLMNFKKVFFMGSYSNLVMITLLSEKGVLISLKVLFLYFLILSFGWSMISPYTQLNFDLFFMFNLSGLPPSPLFFMKVFIFCSLMYQLQIIVLIFMLLSSVIISLYLFFSWFNLTHTTQTNKTSPFVWALFFWVGNLFWLL